MIHRVDLELSDERPIHSELYRAGPKSCDLEKPDIDNMLEMNVINPVQTE